MSELGKYIREHSIRGPCQCGQCHVVTKDGGLVKIKNPEKHQPQGHTADLIFFQVAINHLNPPNNEEFIKLVKEHKGEFVNADIFDGKEHNYIELGAWIGDQGLALMMMGLGELLGCWKLLTPKNMLPTGFDMSFVMELAGRGMVAIQATA